MFVALSGCAAFVAAPSQIGDEYMGARYVLDPLGECTAPDADPLIRFDAFDCTTFVETVLAGGDVKTLNKIRYRNGVVSFENRNHFIESEWLENNADLVYNASSQYAPTVMRHVRIDRAGWFRTVHGIDIDAAPRDVELEYIPYKNLGSINNASPLIVLFVVGSSSDMAAKTGTDLAVVHMGFLMPGGKILRHASSAAGRVIDTDFAEYVDMRRNMQNNIGISLIGIQE